MPQINILNILQGDNQSTIVDKLNYNFDQILSAGGGPQGSQGLIGPTGPIGPQGYQGVQGVQGASGTKWFVQDAPPIIGSVTGSNPWNYPTLGDYWLDPDSANQDVYVFTATGWVNTGYGLNAGEILQNVSPIDISGGATAQGILIAGATSSNKSLVISDSSISEYTPGGIGIQNINFENSKLKIATKDSRTKLISFGRSEWDISPGGSGSTSSNNNPSIAWDLSYNPGSPSSVGEGFYGINFTNPKGSIGISSNGPIAESGINILSSSEITATSAGGDISLSTSDVSKGIFLSVSPINGFLEFNNTSSSNQGQAPIFANSTGVGLGLGTGEFKQSGNDSRRLAVSGNVSIGKTSSSHSSNLFVGGNKGALFVEGNTMIGYTGPTGDPTSGIATTGPSESVNIYPQLFVASSNFGPGIQVKTKGSNYSPRTVIGDGVNDRGALITSAGTGPDISQEFFAGPGYSFESGALISYHHKITNSTNSGVTGPVFSITTFSNSGTYSSNTTAQKTLIQTLNSNKLLELMANGTGGDKRVNIGVSNSPLLTVWGSNTSPTGGITIGASAGSYSPSLGNISGSNVTTAGAGAGINMPNHSLFVTGFQTIGSSEVYSNMNPFGINQSSNFGGNSMLKITRNLFTSTLSSGGSTVTNGAPVNNYANGLEITSFRSSGSAKGSPISNNSVAIAVGSSNIIRNSSNNPVAFNPTGFFVSDTGENIAIGQSIDDTAAIGVSGAGSDYAIKAKGNIGVTGSVYANLGSESSPSFASNSFQNTGIYFRGSAGQEIAFSHLGSDSLILWKNGTTATELIFLNGGGIPGPNGKFINYGNFLQIKDFVNGVEIAGNLIVNETTITKNLTANDNTTFGPGTTFKGMYTGKIRFTRVGISGGNATVLLGKDKYGTSLTIDVLATSAFTVRIRVNFPTSMPTSNIITVCQLDSDEVDDYRWSVLCYARNSGYIELVCTNPSGWAANKSIDVSFIAYCV